MASLPSGLANGHASWPGRLAWPYSLMARPGLMALPYDLRPYGLMAWPYALWPYGLDAWPYDLTARPYGLMALWSYSLALWPGLLF